MFVITADVITIILLVFPMSEWNIGYCNAKMSPKRTIQVLVVWIKNSVRT